MWGYFHRLELELEPRVPCNAWLGVRVKLYEICLLVWIHDLLYCLIMNVSCKLLTCSQLCIPSMYLMNYHLYVVRMCNFKEMHVSKSQKWWKWVFQSTPTCRSNHYMWLYLAPSFYMMGSWTTMGSICHYDWP